MIRIYIVTWLKTSTYIYINATVLYLKIVRRRNFSCKLSLLDVFWNNLLFGLEQEEEDLFVVVEFWELVDEVAVQK